MTDQIVVAVVGEISNGSEVLTYGFSNFAYHDPALASSLVRGTFLTAIDPSQSINWSESIRFGPQGGSVATQVSDITLINTQGDFDEFRSYSVAGLSWVLKWGRPDQSWDEFTTVFQAIGEGSPEFTGRERVTIRVRDIFADLFKPVSQIVFDESVVNERLINRLAPAVYGSVLQVAAIVTDPARFSVYAASNLGVVNRVSEGGRPTDAWVDIDNGYQLTQSVVSETLPITADIGGPPLPNVDLTDLLADVGSFQDWDSSGLPDGFTVDQSPPDSEITEDTTNGGADVKSEIGVGTGGSDLYPSSTTRTIITISGNSLLGYDASDTLVPNTADWPPLIAADDAARLEFSMGGNGIQSPRLTLRGFGAALGSGEQITGIELEARVQRTTGTAAVTFDEVRLILPNGSVSDDKAAATSVPATKTLQSFGGSTDLWGLESLSDVVVNSSLFGVRIRMRTDGAGNRPVIGALFEARLIIYTNSGATTLKLYRDVSMQTGGRYRLRITYDDLITPPTTRKSISIRFAGVETTSSPIPDLRKPTGASASEISIPESQNNGDASAVTFGTLEGAGVFEAEFIADDSVFGIEFFQAQGQTGTQRIVQIELVEISVIQNRYYDLIRAIAEDAGFDLATQVDNASLESVADKTGNPTLGWYIRNQTSRIELMNIFSHSLSAVAWGGIDGQIRAAFMELPKKPQGQFLEVGPERKLAPVQTFRDEGENLRDRAHAAQNIDPLRPNETAGVIDTWPETERQKALADWRLTERADFEVIEAGNVWPITPPPVVDSITPATGPDTGGTAVTIAGSKFISAGLAVTIDGNPATGITLIDSSTIECTTPAGTAGAVDVVVTHEGGSDTLAGGFTYT